MLKRILRFFKRQEIERTISQSGSVPGNKREKVRSGQSYLYKKMGMESEVIEVRFYEKVRGDYLNRALLEAIKRYPYFNTKLLEKDGDFYIVQNDTQPLAKKSKRLARLGGIACGYHLVDITYYGKSLYVSFHHALCDGKGIKPFVETLLWYYGGLRYGNREKLEGVRLAGEPLLEGETVDPFLQTYTFDEGKEYPAFSREAFALPEDYPVEETLNYRYEIILSTKKWVEACKSNHATPVAFFALLMSEAITELYPHCGRVNANIATDMRAALGCENTFKNCVKSMILPFDAEIAALPMEKRGERYREMLNAQRDPEFCKREAMRMMGLFEKLDSLPSFEEKQKVMSYFEGMALRTYVISYLGQFTVGKNGERIDGIFLYNSGATGLGITMTSVADRFVFGFKQNFASEKYALAFCEKLKAYGLSYEYSGEIPFETPTDNVRKRKFTKN